MVEKERNKKEMGNSIELIKLSGDILYLLSLLTTLLISIFSLITLIQI